MKTPIADAQRWLAQARNDLDCARVDTREGFHAQACFLAQQAAEKAAKAVHYLVLGARIVLGHSATELLETLPASAVVPAALVDEARVLDQYYIPTRYPNGLPSGIPASHYTAAQAEAAIRSAQAILDFAGRNIPAPPQPPARSG